MKWASVVVALVTACVSRDEPASPAFVRYPIELSEAATAAGLDVHASLKYSPLDPESPLFTPGRIVCSASLRTPRTEPLQGTLVAIALSAEGIELGRAREKVVLDDEGRPVRFRFDPPVDRRVARYIIDLEAY